MTMSFVHNTGLCEFERLLSGPSSQDVIQEDQVICIDIALFNSPGIRVGASYLVTREGAVPMSAYFEKLLGSRPSATPSLGFAAQN